MPLQEILKQLSKSLFSCGEYQRMPGPSRYDQRHRRVLEQLILHGPLTFEQLQEKAKLRRSDDEFGQVLGELAERRGCRKPTAKPVETWPAGDTRMYAIKADVLAGMVKP